MLMNEMRYAIITNPATGKMTADMKLAGEISLIEVTPEEAQAAKARLDAHNVKRRERHTRKITQSRQTSI